MCLGKQQHKMAQVLGPSAHVADLDEVPGLRLAQPWSIVAFCGVNQQMEDIFLPPFREINHFKNL